jgi:hypothetical protein
MYGGSMTNPSPSPFSLAALLKQLFNNLDRPDAPPKIMEEWQLVGVLLPLHSMLQQAFIEGEKRHIPPMALLVTLDQSQ